MGISPMSTVNITPGTRITRGVGGAGSTAGYFVRRGNQSGFVSTMHGSPTAIANNQRFYVGSAHVGTVRSVSAATDSIFIEASSNVNKTMPVSIFNVSSAAAQEPLEGMTVQMHGSTSGRSVGTITNPHDTFNNASVGPIAVVRASYPRAGGDSGGMVLNITSVFNTRIVGMHVGGGATGAAFVRAAAVNNAHTATPFIP